MTEQDYATLAHVLSTIALDVLVTAGSRPDAGVPYQLHMLRRVAEKLGHYYSQKDTSVTHDYFIEYMTNQLITYYGNTDAASLLLPEPT